MKRWLAGLLLIGCGHQAAPEVVPPGTPKLAVTSTAFAANSEIPSEHTCEGADTPPPLAWTGAPASTKGFALIVDDPDAPDPAAPKQTWVHYVLADIPATATSLPADGAKVGKNDWNKAAWGGPCPPVGRHRYFFKVYALDTTIGRDGLTKVELLDAMKGHVVAEGELVGTYQKKK